MDPYHNYIIVSLLRGRTPDNIVGSLLAIGLTRSVDFTKYSKFLADKEFQKTCKIVKKLTKVDQLDKHQKLLDSYDITDFMYGLLSYSELWAQCRDILSIARYRHFVITLITAGYNTESIIAEFNIKFSVKYLKETIEFIKKYYWNLNGLTGLDRITACEHLTDKKLRESLLSIVDGSKYEGIAEAGAKRMPMYEQILEEILTDAYANYKKYYKKNDPNSRAQLKVWLDVIVKIGDRHNKLKPKNTDELDALIKKIQVDKKKKEEIPSLEDFLKKNKLA